MGSGTTPIVTNQPAAGNEMPGTTPPGTEDGEASPVDPAPVDPAPVEPGPVDASCVGLDDPAFNLDVERPRGDPPPRNAGLPALFVVGDSTVKNHNIQQEGWGDLLDRCFDASRIQVINWGREGRSTRSFIEDGLWGKILAQMVAGDYVMVQFGHNDQSTLDTRGTVPGVGEETQNVVSTTTLLNVEVHTYGYYLRQYAADANAKGAHLIFVTPVPRNYWTSETLTNNSVMAGYVGWMKEVAAGAQLPLLDLNTAIVDIYTAMGRTAVSAYFTSGDNTHTNLIGASTSAGAVLAGVNALAGSDLAGFLAR